jgi:hypothetical protein
MKKIILSFVLLASTITTIVSCSDETLDPVASLVKNIDLTAPTGGNYALDGATAGNNVFTAKWSSADFGYQAAVTYTLQAIKSTGSFSTPQSLVLGSYTENTNSVHEKAITQRQLNTLLLGAGGGIGVSESYKLRVIAKPSTQLSNATNGVMAVSQEITITALAYDTFDEFSRIYVPGSYQSASGYGSDWSPGDANVAKLFSPGNDGKYAGYVYMNAASPLFKFTDGPSWTTNYGFQNDGDFLVTTSSQTNTVTQGSGNLKGDGAGTYWFNVDLSGATKTVTAQKMDYGLIGQFNGWGSDEDVIFNTATKKYEKIVTLAPGGMLLRGNDDWSFKMGALSGSASDATLVPNVPLKIKENGADIQVPSGISGSYKVVVDLRNSANYTMTIIPQ